MAANRANIGWYLDNQIGGEDDRLTGRIYDKIITLTSAEILALNTTAKELVAAPGTGKVLEFISGVVFLDYGTTTYASYGHLIARTGTTNTQLSETLNKSHLVHRVADHYEVLRRLTSDNARLDDNESIELHASDGNPITGNGTIKIKVTYCIHDFN